MKEVSIYKNNKGFEKLEKINGEYIFFEQEKENGETPNIFYPISDFNRQIKEYRKKGYRIKVFNC